MHVYICIYVHMYVYVCMNIPMHRPWPYYAQIFTHYAFEHSSKKSLTVLKVCSYYFKHAKKFFTYSRVYSHFLLTITLKFYEVIVLLECLDLFGLPAMQQKLIYYAGIMPDAFRYLLC